jgi:hypothetical protein
VEYNDLVLATYKTERGLMRPVLPGSGCRFSRFLRNFCRLVGKFGAEVCTLNVKKLEAIRKNGWPPHPRKRPGKRTQTEPN